MRHAAQALRNYAAVLLDLSQTYGGQEKVEEGLRLIHWSLGGSELTEAFQKEQPEAIRTFQRGIEQTLQAELPDSTAQLLTRLLEQLRTRKRMHWIPKILHGFQELGWKRDGETCVHVIFARRFPKSERTRMENALQCALGNALRIRWSIESALLSGFQIRVSDWVLDFSAQGFFEALRRQQGSGSPRFSRPGTGIRTEPHGAFQALRRAVTGKRNGA